MRVTGVVTRHVGAVNGLSPSSMGGLASSVRFLNTSFDGVAGLVTGLAGRKRVTMISALRALTSNGSRFTRIFCSTGNVTTRA